MASTVQVLCPNGRRQNVKVTPNTKLMQVGFCWTVIMGLVSGATNFVSLLLIERCGCKVRCCDGLPSHSLFQFHYRSFCLMDN